MPTDSTGPKKRTYPTGKPVILAHQKPKPPADKEEQLFVTLMVTRLQPDRTPYKQYGIELVPMKVAVSVPVPAKELTVIYQKDENGQDTPTPEYVVLTLAGLTAVANNVADSIDEVHNSHILHLQKGLK